MDLLTYYSDLAVFNAGYSKSVLLPYSEEKGGILQGIRL